MKQHVLAVLALVCTLAVPSLAGTYSNLDQASGWRNCDVCAGQFQAGPRTLKSITQNVKSPSMDGRSLQLWIGGTASHGQVLFYKSLGRVTARHYKTDLYMYLKDANAPQALEFDMYQDLNRRHYVLGAECSLKNTHTWRVYDTQYQHWRQTSVPCSYISPYKWHHLVFEHQSTSDGHTRMVALTVDGKKHYINKTYYSRSGSSTPNATLGLQLDGNASMTDYAVWYDKVTVTTW